MPAPVSRVVNRSFCFQNDGAEPVICCLEPWADELRVGPGESCRFVLTGPEAGEPHLACAPGRITVYAWEGAEGQLERLPTPESESVTESDASYKAKAVEVSHSLAHGL